MEIYVQPNVLKSKASEIRDLINDLEYIESKTRNIQNTLNWSVKSKAIVSLAFKKVLSDMNEFEGCLRSQESFLKESANKYRIAEEYGRNENSELMNDLYGTNSIGQDKNNIKIPYFSNEEVNKLIKRLLEWLALQVNIFDTPKVSSDDIKQNKIEPLKDLLSIIGLNEDQAENFSKLTKDVIKQLFKEYEHYGIVTGLDIIFKPLGIYNTYNGRLDSPFMWGGLVLDGSTSIGDIAEDILKWKGADTDTILGGFFKTAGAFDFLKLGAGSISKTLQKLYEFSKDDGKLDMGETSESLVYGTNKGMVDLLSIAANCYAPGSGIVIDFIDDAFDISDRSAEGHVIFAEAIGKGELGQLGFDYGVTWSYYVTHPGTLVTSLFNGDFTESEMDSFNEWYDFAENARDEIGTFVSDTYETAKENVSSAIDYAKDTVSDVSDYVGDKVEDVGNFLFGWI